MSGLTRIRVQFIEMLGGGGFTYASYESAIGTHILASAFAPEPNMYVIAEVPKAEVPGDLACSATIAALASGLAGGSIGLLVIFLGSRAIVEAMAASWSTARLPRPQGREFFSM